MERVFLQLFYCCLVTQSCPNPFVILWTVARQAPLFTEFSKQESWNGLPFLPPGDLPGPGIELASLGLPALADGFFTTAPPGKPLGPVASLLFLTRSSWRTGLKDSSVSTLLPCGLRSQLTPGPWCCLPWGNPAAVSGRVVLSLSYFGETCSKTHLCLC